MQPGYLALALTKYLQTAFSSFPLKYVMVTSLCGEPLLPKNTHIRRSTLRKKIYEPTSFNIAQIILHSHFSSTVFKP